MGAVFPSARARSTMTSITLPFSACLQMSAPFFVVCRSGAPERHVQMGVDVDSAWHHVHSRSLDNLVGALLHVLVGDLANLFVLDQNIGFERVAGGDDDAIAYECVHESFRRARAA